MDSMRPKAAWAFLKARAMGSLPDGSMCIYCYRHFAGYIPDGSAGPMCGTCMDQLEILVPMLGADGRLTCPPVNLRLSLHWRSMSARLARTGLPIDGRCSFTIAAFIWDV